MELEVEAVNGSYLVKYGKRAESVDELRINNRPTDVNWMTIEALDVNVVNKIAFIYL